MMIEEARFSIGGQDVSVKIWRAKSDNSTEMANDAENTVVALHGWLDNAASFDVLAPLLQQYTSVVAMDFPGHGGSSHRAGDAPYYIWSYIEDVINIADALNLKTFSLLGHSMGGAVASLLSSLYPERINHLALLDSFGPLHTSAEEAPLQMRKALQQRRRLKTKGKRYYASQGAAIAARADRGLSFEAAELLGQRGIESSQDGYFWSSDRRLKETNLLSLTETQINAFFAQITCPVQLITGAELFTSEAASHYYRRLGKINNLNIINLDGSHHQHMEDQALPISKLLNTFFST